MAGQPQRPDTRLPRLQQQGTTVPFSGSPTRPLCPGPSRFPHGVPRRGQLHTARQLIMTPQPHSPRAPLPGAAPPSCSLGAAAGGAVVRRRRLGRALALGRRSFRLPGRPCAAPARSVTFPSSWLCGSGLPEPLVLRRDKRAKALKGSSPAPAHGHH
ncbi:ATP synthase subunit ATP5MJ, mitochondrial isoform X1 [Myotis daubentonii]|uniref:ATP synthase subunit ATP5MJ, mitochondrial isoform X1 n=1 Tax=Myotis daubentonii TaxID=98922 RepID=UPI00287361E9|nr:ATP synthase subunit ATP5MJ, mitochondrial isoform X1 [Myotis daubentonii]